MTNTTRAFAVFMTMLLAVSAVGVAFTGGVAAETTTLAGDGTDQVTGFEANASNDIATSIAADGTDFGTDGTTVLKMNVSYDGETYAVTSEDVATSTDASQTVNISNDELSDLPGDAGANTTVTVTTWGVDADGNTTTAEASFKTDITFANTYAVTTADDTSATIEEPESGFFSLNSWTLGLFGTSSDEKPDLHTYENTVGIDGSNTTVTLNDETSNGSDAFSDAMEDKEAGDLIYGASAAADGTPVLAFYQEADTDMVDETDTYAVYDANGNDEWTFELGDAQADATEVDLFVSSQSYTDVDSFESADLADLFKEQADMGVSDLGSAFGWGSLSTFYLSGIGLGMIGTGGASLAGFGLFFAGRRRLFA
ncbi:hypothetical protein [Natrinema sp. DC36]|uniref:hypothetical protein n=1 Tax=Natrinema sp. DC36 TaxID=2878680 RepID=UPI001CF083E0|nr:hypothetical protein [Natrinema sp. DC36]